MKSPSTRVRLEDGVGYAELLALVRIVARHVAVGVTVAVDDLLLVVDDQCGGDAADQAIEDGLDEERAVHLDEYFRLAVGKRSQAYSFAGVQLLAK